MRTRSTILGFAILTVLLTAGAAQSLSGTNTVFSDDIVDGTITTADLKANSISGSRILDNGITGAKVYPDTLTGTDIKESTIPGFKKVYFARVMFVYADGTESGPKGARLYGGNATSATFNETTLEYKVTFPVNVTACAPSVTNGVLPDRLTPPQIAANPQSRPVAATRIVAASPNDVFVNFKYGTSASVDNFSLVLVCP